MEADRNQYEEAQKILKEIVNALDELSVIVSMLIKEAVEKSPEAKEAMFKFLELLSKIGQSLHLAVEIPRFMIALFPLGTGEPQMLIITKQQEALNQSDQEWLKAHGFKPNDV